MGSKSIRLCRRDFCCPRLPPSRVIDGQMSRRKKREREIASYGTEETFCSAVWTGPSKRDAFCWRGHLLKPEKTIQDDLAQCLAVVPY